jgi:hypothetical protein
MPAPIDSSTSASTPSLTIYADPGSAYTWTSTPAFVPAEYGESEQVYDEEDVVEPIHPVFVVPVGVAERTRRYFEGMEYF